MSTLSINTARVFLPLLNRSRYKGAWGGRGCVHGDTKISTPTGDIAIKDFVGGEIFAVGRNGVEVVTAGVPVVYPPEPLFRVTLTNDKSVICTASHKFMTPSGWTEADQRSYVSCLPVERFLSTSLAPREKCSSESPSGLREDVLRCLRIILGWLYRCSEDYHLCDGSPLSQLNTYRDIVHTLTDEQEHNSRTLTLGGDQDNGCKHDRRQSSRLLSIPASLLAGVVQSCEAQESCSDEISSVLLSVTSLCARLFLGNTDHFLLVQELSKQLLVLDRLKDQGEIPRIVADTLALSVDDMTFSDSLVECCTRNHFTIATAVRSIEYYGEEHFYDIFVPFYNNYIADGMIHHNSGKSHFFAEKLIEDHLAEPGESGEGLRSVCIREVQKDLAQSSKLLIETKLKSLGLGEADGFKPFRELIQTPNDGLIIFKGMNDYTADSIKSLEGFKRAWWEEAQTATALSLNLLRPTLRADGSELWFSWNPRRKIDPIDVMLRGAELPTDAIVIRSNWKDNPWITKELEQERLDCLRMQPDQYDHIWEGGYITVIEGAYYAKALTEARAENRIGRVAADPLMAIRLMCDIGGTGAKADAFTIWACQFIGKEIRILNYYEAVGQPLATHLAWMRSQGYSPDKTQIWLPHDGDTQDKVYDVSYASALRDAGYTVTVVPNQGKGAAAARIEAGRRLFPCMWFNEATTDGGLSALGWYHEKKDETRNIGLGPDHDWASHGADAFGLMCVVYEEPKTKKPPAKTYYEPTSWQGA